MGSWPVIKDLIGFCFFTIFSSRNGPSRRLSNNRNTSALMQERGKTPPSNANPPPLLIWAERNHVLVPESHQTIHLHPIMPHVSLVSCQFPRLEAFQNTCLGPGDHYPSLMIIIYFFLSSTKKSKFVFSFKVQALEEFMSWTRWKGLLTFLYYRWRSIYLVTIECFFFPKNLFGKTMRNEAWNEAGSGRDGMSRSLGRIVSLKNDERRMEVRDYLHVDLSSLMAI